MQDLFKIVFITFVVGVLNFVCGGFLYLFSGIAGKLDNLFFWITIAPLATFVLLCIFAVLKKQTEKTLAISLLPIPISWAPLFINNLNQN